MVTGSFDDSTVMIGLTGSILAILGCTTVRAPWIGKINGTPEDWVHLLQTSGVPLPEGVSMDEGAEATQGDEDAAAPCT